MTLALKAGMRLAALAAIVVAPLALAACNDSNPFYNSNNFQDANFVKANVIPNKSTKADVERALGRPSSTSHRVGRNGAGSESWDYSSNGAGGIRFDSLRAVSSALGVDSVSSVANDAVGYQQQATTVDNTVNSGQVRGLTVYFEGDVVESYSYYN